MGPLPGLDFDPYDAELKRNFFTSRQPFKSFYLLYIVFRLFCLIPWWLFLAVVLRQRPRKSWSVLTTLVIKSIRNFAPTLSRCDMTMGRDLLIEPEALSLKHTRFAWAPPLQPGHITGYVKECAKHNNIRATRVPCFLYSRDKAAPMQAEEPNESLILYCHGGSYIVGTAHERDSVSRMIPQAMLRHSRVGKVLSVDYRIRTPFPSSVLDAAAAYVYAVKTLGYKPEHIILIGDSAGANLILATVRYLRDSQIVGMPAGCIPVSAWADMILAQGGSGESNHASDYLDREVGVYSCKLFFGRLPVSQRGNPYFSPGATDIKFNIEKDFSGFPPMLFIVGDAEMLLDQAILTYERLKQAGCKAELKLYKDAVHDFVLFPRFLQPAATQAKKDMANWIDDLLASDGKTTAIEAPRMRGRL